MEIDFNKFIALVENEFEDIPKGNIEPSSLLSDFIEMNSLNTLVLSILFESEFNQSIDFDKIKSAENFNQLYALIKR